MQRKAWGQVLNRGRIRARNRTCMIQDLTPLLRAPLLRAPLFQTGLSACVRVAVVMGLIVWGMPSGVAGDLTSPDKPSESIQTHTPTPGHVDIHAVITEGKSAEAAKSESAVETDTMKHPSVQDHARVFRRGAAHKQSVPKAVHLAAKAFNMDVLIERLKKTDAIGMFTKLALRSNVLDLMGMIKAYHRHVSKYSLKALRARFDGLILTVLALLNGDPKLSRDISLGRNQIWNSLLTTTVKKATRKGPPDSQSARRGGAVIALLGAVNK